MRHRRRGLSALAVFLVPGAPVIAGPINAFNMVSTYGDRGGGVPFSVSNPTGSPIPLDGGQGVLMSAPDNQFWDVHAFVSIDSLQHVCVSEANASEMLAGEPMSSWIEFLGDATIDPRTGLAVSFTTVDGRVIQKMLAETWWMAQSGASLELEVLPLTLSDVYPGDFSPTDEVIEIEWVMGLVPEPFVLMLLAGGALGLSVRRHRQ